MKVHVDPQRCMGHGMCHALAGEVYQINEDTGYNEMGVFEVSPQHRVVVTRGISACPEQAISIISEES